MNGLLSICSALIRALERRWRPTCAAVVAPARFCSSTALPLGRVRVPWLLGIVPFCHPGLNPFPWEASFLWRRRVEHRTSLEFLQYLAVTINVVKVPLYRDIFGFHGCNSKCIDVDLLSQNINVCIVLLYITNININFLMSLVPFCTLTRSV